MRFFKGTEKDVCTNVQRVLPDISQVVRQIALSSLITQMFTALSRAADDEALAETSGNISFSRDEIVHPLTEDRNLLQYFAHIVP